MRAVAPQALAPARRAAVAALRAAAAAAEPATAASSAAAAAATTTNTTPTVDPFHRLLRRGPAAPALRSYYPPDVDVHRLARQDPALASLPMRDLWLDAKLAREDEWRKR
ncbi:hypothetical protein HK405_001083, partial [Cladochytrium tenue]